MQDLLGNKIDAEVVTTSYPKSWKVTPQLEESIGWLGWMAKIKAVDDTAVTPLQFQTLASN